MGRYYRDTINDEFSGKFYFGTQDSDAADRFGTTANEPQFIYYYYGEDDLEEVQGELNNIEEYLLNEIGSELFVKYNIASLRGTKTETHIDKRFNNMWDFMNNDIDKCEHIDKNKFISEFADFELGAKIEYAILTNGECELECEL
jgi:hypothetical protein